MIEIQCPFCDQACRINAADFSAEMCSLRCDDCGVVVEIDAVSAATVQPLAA